MLLPVLCLCAVSFFFFNSTATTEIYTLSLHDALPILLPRCSGELRRSPRRPLMSCSFPCLLDLSAPTIPRHVFADRKSTRLNSSHRCISYAVFCLKKKTKKQN